LDINSFAPTAVLAPMPLLTELAFVLGALATSTPELTPGAGDVLVSNASAHLPFSATRTANSAHPCRGLWDPTLQNQVVAILLRLRSPTVSGHAATRISPHPASLTPAQHVVTAEPRCHRHATEPGSVAVYDTHGALALRAGLGSPFTFGFAPRRFRVMDPVTHRFTWETAWPTVEVDLRAPYGVVGVDTGRGPWARVGVTGTGRQPWRDARSCHAHTGLHRETA
jgi:hypothetical protein